jgi:hypothetical protein
LLLDEKTLKQRFPLRLYRRFTDDFCGPMRSTEETIVETEVT